jgi:hypothetical protein
MMLEKKDQIEALANVLMEKETVNLPEIIDVLGERPYGMSEGAAEYLVEMREKIESDAVKAAEDAVKAAEACEAVEAAEEAKEEENLNETLADESKPSEEDKSEEKKDEK